MSDANPGREPGQNLSSETPTNGSAQNGQDEHAPATDVFSKKLAEQDWLLKPGEVVGKRYEIVSVIGSGGMGVVYKVKQPYLSKFYALKTVRSLMLSEQVIARFRTEAKAASALNHPALITVYDFGLLDDGQPFLVMDLVETGSLADAIAKQGLLEVGRVLAIFVQATGALGYAHEHKIIHRDLKPSNVLLDISEDGERVRIADFGVAKILEDDSGAGVRLTQTGEMLGSPLYMSPEQCAGKIADERSDIYSLGCTMFEALTGRPPFQGESALATLMLHQKGDVPTLSAAAFGIKFPDELEEVIATFLAKDPAKRFRTMEEAQQALIDILVAKPGEGKNKPGKRKRDTRRTAGVPLPVVIISFVVGMVASSLITAQVVGNMLSRKNEMGTQEQRPHPPAENITLMGKWNPKTSDSDKTTIKDNMRIFHFPEKFSMGALYTLNSNFYGESVLLAQAQGTRVAPVNALLKFRPNWAICEIPYAFDLFRPDDLAAIDFGNLPVTDQVLEHIAPMKSLRMLSLGNTEITDAGLRYLFDLPNLFYLSLGNTDVTGKGILSLLRIKSLTDLNLNCVRLDEQARDYFRQAVKLRRLALKGTGITDADLKTFGEMKKLIRLRLDDNKDITNQGIKHLTKLPSLQILLICRCKVTPDVVVYLKQMPKLRIIQLGKTDWTPEQIAKVQEELPKLEIWTMPHNGSRMFEPE